MNVASTMYSRIISADRDRGYVLLFSWDKPVVQRTCYSLTTLSVLKQEYIDAAKENIMKRACAKEIIDVTEPALLRKINKIMSEEKSVPNE